MASKYPSDRIRDRRHRSDSPKTAEESRINGYRLVESVIADPDKTLEFHQKKLRLSNNRIREALGFCQGHLMLGSKEEVGGRTYIHTEFGKRALIKHKNSLLRMERLKQEKKSKTALSA